MNSKTLQDILQRYLAGTATPGEREIVEMWYALIEENPQPSNDRELQILEEKIWAKLKENATREITGEGNGLRYNWRLPFLKIAAIFVIVFIPVFYLIFSSGPATDAETVSVLDPQVVFNQTASPQTVHLSDGSVVKLEPGGKLEYPSQFEGSTREVHLSGEAFFEVEKVDKTPFLVHTQKITTRVLGTSFRVKAPDDGSDIEVMVKTGSVSVFERRKPVSYSERNTREQQIVLTPNEQIRFIQDEGRFIKELAPDPQVVTGDGPLGRHRFHYNDTELAEILRDLSVAYQIKIVPLTPSVASCPLTANLAGKTLYVQLDLICAAIQGSYKIEGTTIYIEGTGCE